MADDNSYLGALASPTPDEATVPAISPLWPNYIKSIMDIPKNLIDTAANTPVGLRREDVTDIPGSAQPIDPLVKATTDQAISLAGNGMPMAETGAAGIFGGKLAKTADIDKLSFANKMNEAGMPQAQILDATGWFRSPTDRKWRFEIPDEQARMMGHGLNYANEGDSITGPAHAMLQHPELFKAYPELGNVKLQNSVFSKPRNGIGKGTFYRDPQRMLEVNAPDLKRATTVGLHEMQHGVQDIENFSGGGNPSMMAYLQENHPAKLPMHEWESDPIDMYQRLAGEVEARNVQNRAFPGERAKLPWETQDVPFSQQLTYDRSKDIVRALRNLK